MDTPMMKPMSDLMKMMSGCMAQFRKSACKMMPEMASGCMESHMKKSMCDCMMMIPQCMSNGMDMQCGSCMSRKMPAH
jgi:hypothetical protein